MICAASPVSYTHLDVYKRQLYKLAGSTPKSITGFARGVLKQAGLSATEAGVSSYMRTLADLYVMGEDSRYEQYRRGLTAKGMSGEEATREANMEFFLREPVMEMAQGAGGGAAVVCKRRHCGGTGADLGGKREAGPDQDGGYAVSYTHLDVYKRQGVLMTKLVRRNGIFLRRAFEAAAD